MTCGSVMRLCLCVCCALCRKRDSLFCLASPRWTFRLSRNPARKRAARSVQCSVYSISALVCVSASRLWPLQLLTVVLLVHFMMQCKLQLFGGNLMHGIEHRAGDFPGFPLLGRRRTDI